MSETRTRTDAETIQSAIDKLEELSIAARVPVADPLTVTLHRTIDAQRAVLSRARANEMVRGTRGWCEPIWMLGMELAEAILGQQLQAPPPTRCKRETRRLAKVMDITPDLP